MKNKMTILIWAVVFLLQTASCTPTELLRFFYDDPGGCTSYAGHVDVDENTVGEEMAYFLSGYTNSKTIVTGMPIAECFAID